MVHVFLIDIEEYHYINHVEKKSEVEYKKTSINPFG